MMKAVVLDKPCTAKDLVVREVPMPKVKPGWVLVKVKAFGINRSEIYTRQGLSPSVKLPRILGIECVGEVADSSDSTLQKGQRVLSMMGGLGRDFNGSYAEYALIPSSQVYPAENTLAWEEFAAFPEMYYTAWCSLTDALRLKGGETLLIRGGTSSVGLAAIQIAKSMGATVVATTRREEKRELLERHGADRVLTDDARLAENMRRAFPKGVEKILELVGAVTLQSSFEHLAPGGILCMSGILGGKWELEKFAPMESIPSGGYFTIYDSQRVDRASLHTMFAFLQENRIQPTIAKVFTLSEIANAHAYMESNTANGKIVVVNPQEYHQWCIQ